MIYIAVPQVLTEAHGIFSYNVQRKVDQLCARPNSKQSHISHHHLRPGKPHTLDPWVVLVPLVVSTCGTVVFSYIHTPHYREYARLAYIYRVVTEQRS